MKLLLVDLVEHLHLGRAICRCETGPPGSSCPNASSAHSPQVYTDHLDLVVTPSEPLAPDAAEPEETGGCHWVLPFIVLVRRESHPTDQLALPCFAPLRTPDED